MSKSERVGLEAKDGGARVISRRALHYSEGADASVDRPAHVRAGSALAWLGEPSCSRLAVVQDDASFLALVDLESGSTSSITLDHAHEGQRQFDSGRGNKKHKLDLEACARIDTRQGPRLVVIGSGSLAARERFVLLDPHDGSTRIIALPELYASLRAHTAFSGSELNIEGAAVVHDRLRLFQRGNGAPRGELSPVDATCELALDALLAHLEGQGPAPAPRDITRYSLGAIDGVRLTFTDACADDDGRVLFLAAAEASPDAIEDGEVVGVAMGVIERDGSARWTRIADESGAPFLAKAEGLVLARGRTERGERTAWLVVDRDDPALPTELCAIAFHGL